MDTTRLTDKYHQVTEQLRVDWKIHDRNLTVTWPCSANSSATFTLAITSGDIFTIASNEFSFVSNNTLLEEIWIVHRDNCTQEEMHSIRCSALIATRSSATCGTYPSSESAQLRCTHGCTDSSHSPRAFHTCRTIVSVLSVPWTSNSGSTTCCTRFTTNGPLTRYRVYRTT